MAVIRSVEYSLLFTRNVLLANLWLFYMEYVCLPGILIVGHFNFSLGSWPAIAVQWVITCKFTSSSDFTVKQVIYSMVQMFLNCWFLSSSFGRILEIFNGELGFLNLDIGEAYKFTKLSKNGEL